MIIKIEIEENKSGECWHCKEKITKEYVAIFPADEDEGINICYDCAVLIIQQATNDRSIHITHKGDMSKKPESEDIVTQARNWAKDRVVPEGIDRDYLFSIRKDAHEYGQMLATQQTHWMYDELMEKIEFHVRGQWADAELIQALEQVKGKRS